MKLINKMIYIMAKYKIKKDKLEEVKRAVIEFISAVKENEEGTLRYEAFQLKDSSLDFVHLMVFDDEKSREMHSSSDYVKKFVETLYPCCEKEPEFIDLDKLNNG